MTVCGSSIMDGCPCVLEKNHRGPCHATIVRGLEKPPSQAVIIPGDYIVFKTKLSDGTIIKLPLPPRLSERDVERICAFLRSQADDE